MSDRLPHKGFTLIELMIVVAIIGVLSAIAVPKFADLIRKSKEGSTKGSLGGIRSALSVYYSGMDGQFPDDPDAMTINRKYIHSIPTAKTPPWHADSNSFILTSDQTIDGGGWGYNNVTSDRNWGVVWVRCSHTDARNTLWTSY